MQIMKAYLWEKKLWSNLFNKNVMTEYKYLWPFLLIICRKMVLLMKKWPLYTSSTTDYKDGRIYGGRGLQFWGWGVLGV